MMISRYLVQVEIPNGAKNQPLHIYMQSIRRLFRQATLRNIPKRLGLAGSLGLSILHSITCFSDSSEQKLSNGIAFKSSNLSLPVLDYSKPVFCKGDKIVIFVVGGPGAGKGTQCERVAQNIPRVVHISAGDLLREERMRLGSQYGELINHYIAEGLIVPMEITINLLKIQMQQTDAKVVLIDGFPRAIDQGLAFERSVCPSTAIIYLECPEEILESRLLKRGQSSGRVDDNISSIKKRFQTFIDTSLPVVEYYRGRGNVHTINSSAPAEQVFEEFNELIKSIIMIQA